jgi:CRP-like cAMP-binding protein
MSPVEKVLCLQRVDIFRHATTEMLAYISAIADVVEVQRGVTIFHEQDISDAMFVVVTGRVRLEKEGREVLAVGPCESVGAWALFDNAPRLMTAVALEDTVLLKIGSDSFYEFLADHEEVTPAIFRAVIERVKALAPEVL